ncbi:MAG: phenylacetate--CoA ligase family protein [Alphaproteobacteria bacterium]
MADKPPKRPSGVAGTGAPVEPPFAPGGAGKPGTRSLPELTPGVLPGWVVHTPRPPSKKPPAAAAAPKPAPPAAKPSAPGHPTAAARGAAAPDTGPPPLPGSVRSTVEAIAWPAIPRDRIARDLALQFQLSQSQWWSPERIREHQFHQLSQLLRHAGATVPFYRRLFKRIGFDPKAPLRPEDWAQLPVLTRRDIQESFTALQSEAVPKSHGGTFTCSSSGSTATPITVVKTSLQQALWRANTLRDHMVHKRDMSLRLASIRHWEEDTDYPYPDGGASSGWGSSSAAFATGRGFMLGLATKVHQQAEWLQRVRPNYLMSYPSNFEALAHHCIDRGIAFPFLVELRAMSEVVRPEVRDICRRAWGVEIKDTYTAEEIGWIAFQSPVCEEMLVHAETVLVEVLDDSGKPCPPGQAGRVIATPLHAFAMPLIRYVQGDLAVPGDKAACGRGLPVLKEILGRERNMVRLPNGHVHYPSYHYLTQGQDKIVQFQIVRKEIELLEVRLVARAPLDEAEERTLADRIRERFQYPFQVRLAYVDDIQRTPRGKFIDFISEVD